MVLVPQVVYVAEQGSGGGWHESEGQRLLSGAPLSAVGLILSLP